MKNASKLTVLGLILTTGVTLCTPMMASADGFQQKKNVWGDVAIGSALLTGVGIANHNGTETAIGAIGTIVGLTQYEQGRNQRTFDQNCNNNVVYDAPAPCVTPVVNVDVDRDNRRFNDDGSRFQPRTSYRVDERRPDVTQDRHSNVIQSDNRGGNFNR